MHVDDKPAVAAAGANLARMLGLRPLDRLQVSSTRTISESRFEARMAGHPDWSNNLPWWFFQRVTNDGRLEVMAPGGYATIVDPHECCDIRPGEPIRLMAMPAQVFLARLKLPPNEARKAPCESEYAPALVRYVTKDRWGRVDRIAVEFEACELNRGNSTFNQVRQEDREALNRIARRDRMPVVESLRSTMASADRGEQRKADQARYATATFFRHSLRNDPATAPLRDALRESGAMTDPLTSLAINKIEAKLLGKKAQP